MCRPGTGHEDSSETVDYVDDAAAREFGVGVQSKGVDGDMSAAV